MDSDTATVIVAGLSLVLSAYAVWRQHASAGRANFTADWEGSRLALVNQGPGAAKKVRVRLSNARDEPADPIRYLGPFQVTRVHASLRLGEPPPTLTVEWKDNRLRQQTLELHLPSPPMKPPTPKRSALETAVRELARDEVATRERWRTRNRRPF